MILYILTYKRLNKQITYNSLPGNLKRKVVFVVQLIDYFDFVSKYKNNQIVLLPDYVNNIGKTRQYVVDNNRHQRFAMLDDDLQFIKKDYLHEKWKTTNMNKIDFELMINNINKKMDEGFKHIGLASSSITPSIKYYPYNINNRIMTNVFYDILDDIKIDYERADTSEDFDVNLTLLSSGYKNCIFTKYRVKEGKYHSEGGCSTYRTIEYHNDNMLKLKKLWPDFIKLKVNDKTGRYKATIQWKKCYNKSQK